MSLQSLGGILRGYAPESPLRKSVTSALVVETANSVLKEMFGAEVTQLASAVSVWHRTLTIACLSTTSASAIKMRENELIKGIKEKLGVDEVARLRFLS